MNVSWSLETLLLAFIVIALLCAIYVGIKAFQTSPKWGLLFALSPVVFYFLSGYVGWLIAGLVIFAAQIYYVREPYNWSTWGRIYVYMVLCWIGGTVLMSRTHGWVPASWRSEEAQVQMAGAPASGATESHLAVAGGRIWYRRSGTGTGAPVILLHGGPGAGSFYLKSLEALGDERPVVRYDQLGAGHADRANDTTLFTIPRFVAELDSLRAAVGIERFHVVGHSWGAMLAVEYYRAHPERIASLTLASPSLSIPLWTRNARRLLATLSDSAQDRIRASEAVADYDSPDYQAAVGEFSSRYVSLRPVEADMDSTMRTFGQRVYRHMWGPSEFTVTGTLKRYDASRKLRAIGVPALYTVGEFDEADTATVRRFADATPGARYAVIPDAAHITSWDNPTELLRVIREFLRAVDAVDTAAAGASPTP